MKQWLKLLASEPKYKPNEADLQVASLTAFVSWLRKLNGGVIYAFTRLRNANDALDKLLYGEGIHGIVRAAKGYIESVYGKGSKKHREATQIQFRKS